MKMAMVSNVGVWLQPQAYFGILQKHIKNLKSDT